MSRQYPGTTGSRRGRSRRSACDRCRVNKLRCERDGHYANDGPCDRCLKLNVPCRKSPDKGPGLLHRRTSLHDRATTNYHLSPGLTPVLDCLGDESASLDQLHESQRFQRAVELEARGSVHMNLSEADLKFISDPAICPMPSSGTTPAHTSSTSHEALLVDESYFGNLNDYDHCGDFNSFSFDEIDLQIDSTKPMGASSRNDHLVPSTNTLRNLNNVDMFKLPGQPSSSSSQAEATSTTSSQLPTTQRPETHSVSDQVHRRLLDLNVELIADHAFLEDASPRKIQTVACGGAPVDRILARASQLWDIVKSMHKTNEEDDPFEPPPERDIFLTITMVTSYVLLVRIYRRVLNGVYDDFRKSPSSSVRSSALPALQFGNFQVDDNVSIRLQVLLELSCSMLQRISKCMGMPGMGISAGHGARRSIPEVGSSVVGSLAKVILQAESSQSAAGGELPLDQVIDELRRLLC